MENKEVIVRKETVEKKENMDLFELYLLERENAPATIQKYKTDVRTFFRYMDSNHEITKECLLQYKNWLIEHYALSSVNSMLVALNQYLVCIGLERWKLRRVKTQRKIYEEEHRKMSTEEYFCLIETARSEGKERLALMMETMCSTGIRVSELKFFTVESIRNGIVKVWNKGKYRLVVMPEKLCKKLEKYVQDQKLQSGMIFVTRNGKAVDRSNIWREMKKLAEKAGIAGEIIFPHNLRHLFGRTFFHLTRNLVLLADILGHSSMEVTRIYASDGIASWKEKIEKLNLVI